MISVKNEAMWRTIVFSVAVVGAILIAGGSLWADTVTVPFTLTEKPGQPIEANCTATAYVGGSPGGTDTQWGGGGGSGHATAMASAQGWCPEYGMIEQHLIVSSDIAAGAGAGGARIESVLGYTATAGGPGLAGPPHSYEASASSSGSWWLDIGTSEEYPAGAAFTIPLASTGGGNGGAVTPTWSLDVEDEYGVGLLHLDAGTPQGNLDVQAGQRLGLRWSYSSGVADGYADGSYSNWVYADIGTGAPEPATLALLAVGGLMALRRRR